MGGDKCQKCNGDGCLTFSQFVYIFQEPDWLVDLCSALTFSQTWQESRLWWALLGWRWSPDISLVLQGASEGEGGETRKQALMDGDGWVGWV